MASFKYWVSFNPSFFANACWSNFVPFIHVCFIVKNVWPQEVCHYSSGGNSDFSLVMNAGLHFSLLIASATSQQPMNWSPRPTFFFFDNLLHFLHHNMEEKIWCYFCFIKTLRKLLKSVIVQKWITWIVSRWGKMCYRITYLASLTFIFFNLNRMSQSING